MQSSIKRLIFSKNLDTVDGPFTIIKNIQQVILGKKEYADNVGVLDEFKSMFDILIPDDYSNSTNTSTGRWADLLHIYIKEKSPVTDNFYFKVKAYGSTIYFYLTNATSEKDFSLFSANHPYSGGSSQSIAPYLYFGRYQGGIFLWIPTAQQALSGSASSRINYNCGIGFLTTRNVHKNKQEVYLMGCGRDYGYAKYGYYVNGSMTKPIPMFDHDHWYNVSLIPGATTSQERTDTMYLQKIYFEDIEFKGIYKTYGNLYRHQQTFDLLETQNIYDINNMVIGQKDVIVSYFSFLDYWLAID